MNLSFLHPIINHFTIALFSVAVILDVVGMLSRKPTFHEAARINLYIAGAAVILTVITGLVALNTLKHGEELHEMMESHETLGYVAGGLVFLAALWRILTGGSFPQKARALYLALLACGFVAVYVNAFWGGEMAFKYGITSTTYQESIQGEAGHHHEGQMHEEGESQEPHNH